MKYGRARAVVIVALLGALAAVLYFRSHGDMQLDAIGLPPGFSIEIYADGIDNPRSMTLGDSGTVFVGSRSAGKVYAIVDADNDYSPDSVHVIASDLKAPNGVAFRQGALYVAEVTRILRFDSIEAHLLSQPRPVVIVDDLPSETHHGNRYIGFGPDDKLYVAVGAPCNVCMREDDERFATILRMNHDGTEPEVFARGVRNSVGFSWHPKTGELWFTDNGRDWLGNEAPPDELNRAEDAGKHFGFPFCHGGFVDGEFGGGHSCEEFVPPVQRLGPHVASLGMRFYTGDMFPAEYRGQIFIAEHGSWNRVPPIGYRVTWVGLAENEAVDYQVFAEGWLRKGRSWGRPVDVLVLPDGSLLISDDVADVVYRVVYDGIE